MKKLTGIVSMEDVGEELDDELYAMESTVLIKWMPDIWRPGDPV